MYYFNLPTPILSQETINYLISYATEREEKFLAYKGQKTGATDGNNYLLDGVGEIPEVKELVSRCSIQTYPLLLLHKPGVQVIRHIDNPNKRNSVIIQPLAPRGEYSPTYFWRDYDSLEPVAIADFHDMNPKVIDTQKIHDLSNPTEHLRINFQLCFSEDFEKVKSLWLDNTLFRN